MVLQRNDSRDDVEGLQASLKTYDFALDNVGGALGLLFAIRHVRGDGLLQIVDVVDENSVHLVHLRINVARYRDIDEEHGTVLAPAHKELAVLTAEDGVRSASRGN